MFKLPEGSTVHVVSATPTRHDDPGADPFRKLRLQLTPSFRAEVIAAASAHVNDRYNVTTFRKYRAYAKRMGVSVGALDSVFGMSAGSFHAARSEFGIPPLTDVKYTPKELREVWGPQQPVRYGDEPSPKTPRAQIAARVNACTATITLPDKQTLNFHVDSKDAADRMHRVLLALL